jgi:hypothetical protein
VEFKPKYLKGGEPIFKLSGWNTKAEKINTFADAQSR